MVRPVSGHAATPNDALRGQDRPFQSHGVVPSLIRIRSAIRAPTSRSRLGQPDGELLAPDPRRRCPRPDLALDDPGEVDQRRVAGRMAQAVVEQLEAIEVGVDQRPVTGAPGLGLGDQLVELAPVGQAGEPVGGRVGGCACRPRAHGPAEAPRWPTPPSAPPGRLPIGSRPPGGQMATAPNASSPDQDRQQHHGARALAPVGDHAAQRVAFHR